MEIIKRALLKSSLPLEKIDFQNHNMPLPYVTRVNSGEKSKIMPELYNAGWSHVAVEFDQDRITDEQLESVAKSIEIKR